MSLEKAVTDIVEMMEGDKDSICLNDGRHSVLSPYAKMLRIALTASKGNQQAQQQQQKTAIGSTIEIDGKRFIVDETGMHLDKDSPKNLMFQEKLEEKMVAIIDTGDMVGIDPGMPIGAFTEIAGIVYELKADGLHATKPKNDKADILPIENREGVKHPMMPTPTKTKKGK